MIQATTNKGTVNLESTFRITEGQELAIKENSDKVEAIMKDFHVSHTIASTEDGTVVSKMGKSMKNNFDPIKEAKDLANMHDAFLNRVDDWLDIKPDTEANNDNEEEPQCVLMIGIPVILF